MSHTQYWPSGNLPAGLTEAAAVLAAGGVVAFPTETVYGLGADARNTAAVRRIFEAKGRPSDNPLIVHLADAFTLDSLALQLNDIENTLIRAFWPGPLTLVLPVIPGSVSPLVTAGLDTIAVRVPAHETARRLIAASGCPIAAPSANRSGRPSPTTAQHVLEDLDGRIDGVLDGGPTGVGLESTVVQVTGGAIHILRPGGVTLERLQAAVGSSIPVAAAAQSTEHSEHDTPRSPGTKYAHYAPQGEMLLISADDPAAMIAAVKQAAAHARRQGRRTGILASSEHAARYEGAADAVVVCGSRQSPESAAQQLYAALRECDRLGLGFIAAEGWPEQGIGAALMNRLRKAAGGRELRL